MHASHAIEGIRLGMNRTPRSRPRVLLCGGPKASCLLLVPLHVSQSLQHRTIEEGAGGEGVESCCALSYLRWEILERPLCGQQSQTPIRYSAVQTRYSAFHTRYSGVTLVIVRFKLVTVRLTFVSKRVTLITVRFTLVIVRFALVTMRVTLVIVRIILGHTTTDEEIV